MRHKTYSQLQIALVAISSNSLRPTLYCRTSAKLAVAVMEWLI